MKKINSKKLKNLLILSLSSLIAMGFLVTFIATPDQSYSMSERRALKKKPKVSVEKIVSGKYMDEFDTYTLDQAPLRDSFRKYKAIVSKNVFLKKDNHGLYLKDGYLSKIEYPENPEKMNRSLDKLVNVYEQYLKNSDSKIYLSIIPDKNCFLAPKDFPAMDYPHFIESVKSRMNFAEYIDIVPFVSLEDFYKTDQHWKQEQIVDVARFLTEKMGTSIKDNFVENELPSPFYGTYYGQAALKVAPDSIKYLTDEIMESCTITSYNTGAAAPSFIYDMKKAKGRDPYEMFLSGSDPLIVIENPAVERPKELIIFRDSFGSSITPLMISAYSKITLVDLRYIQSGMLKNFIDFSNQDVLFLYSTLILNNGL